MTKGKRTRPWVQLSATLYLKMQERPADPSEGQMDVFSMVRVCPRQLSVATGQKRCNLEALARRGYAVRFVPDASLAPGRFGVGPQETRNEKGKQAQ